MSVIQFKSIDRLKVKKSMFDNTFNHLTTMDMGTAVPIMIKEIVPGDIFKMGMRFILRMMPTIAPVLHEIYFQTYTFFVPNRLLYPKPKDPAELSDYLHNWENFITGTRDGVAVDQNNDNYKDDTVIPLYEPNVTNEPQSLWDYMNMPIFDKNSMTLPNGSKPNVLAKRAYNLIYNEYIRDQNMTNWVDLDDDNIKYFCWEKDRFTSSLPMRQRGTAPALPLTGTASVNFDDGYALVTAASQSSGISLAVYPNALIPGSESSYDRGIAGGPLGSRTGLAPSQPLRVTANSFSDMQTSIDVSKLVTADINDLRTSVQIQKYLERNMRAGARYKELIEARFNENGGDARLNRPEFIGATKSPIIISEVLQTSGSQAAGQPGNALGQMGGHGISADASKIGTYKATEHGWIITLCVIRPTTMYEGGIDPQYTRRTHLEYLTPEFVNLSEQAVFTRELQLSAQELENSRIFGYQGIYNEYRYSKSYVTGKMRTTAPGSLAHWHLARSFISMPNLNKTFVECKPNKRIFAVPSEPGFILQYQAINQTVRPLPVMPEPGLMDHH